MNSRSSRIVLIISLGVMLASLVHATRTFLEWRSGRTLSKVAESLSANRWDEAIRVFSSVSRFWAEDEVYERTAQLLDQIRDPAAALERLRPLMEAGTADRPETLEAIAAALRAGEVPTALLWIERNKASFAGDADFAALHIRALMASGRRAEALALLGEARRAHPWHRETRFLSAVLAGSPEDPVERAVVRATLRDIAERDDVLGLEARIRLATTPGLLVSREDRMAAITAITANPYAAGCYLLRDPVVLGGLVAVCLETDPAAGLPFAEALADRPEAGTADLLALARIRQAGGDLDESRAVLKRLAAAGAEGPGMAELEIRQAFLEGAYADAWTLLEARLAENRDLPYTDLVRLFQGRDDLKIDRSVELKAIGRLRIEPSIGDAEYLKVTGRLIELEPQTRGRALPEAVDRVADGLLLAQWLLQWNEPALAVTVLAGYPETGDERLVILRVSALLENDQLDEAGAVLGQLAEPESPEAILLRYRLATARGDGGEALRLWADGFRRIRDSMDNDLIRSYGQAAARAGSHRQAVEAYSVLCAPARVQEAGWEDLRSYLVSLIEMKQSREARRVAARIAASHPGDRESALTFAYLSLILREGMLEAKDIAAGLREAAPDDPEVEMAFAFAVMRTGQPELALRLFDELAGETGEFGPRERIAGFAILSGNGRRQPAEELVHLLKVQELLPEESALLEEYRRDPGGRTLSGRPETSRANPGGDQSHV